MSGALPGNLLFAWRKSILPRERKAPPRRGPSIFIATVRGLCAAVSVLLFLGTRTFAADLGVEFFEKRVRPILVEHCYQCHSDRAAEVKGGLRVDSREALLQGGDSGPAVSLEDRQNSRLLKAVRHEDDLQMPPEKPKLSAAAIADLAAWVTMGAPFPAPSSEVKAKAPHWSFEPIRKPNPPAVKDSSWPRNPLDQFVLARLEQRGLRPFAAADKRTLLRRATFDLTGLPPTPDEVDAFLADATSEAFAKVVDRLLASPRYGERWGRHWLDVVRYADTAGDNTDHPLPHAWRYRNWVIDAFNMDMPYDEFIRAQVAGDLLADSGSGKQYADRVVATGFLASARRFDHDIDKYMHLTFEDTLDTLGKSVLGLSIGCARCHNHKFDPITTRDYYGLYGILASTKFAFPGCEPKQRPRDLVPLLPPAEVARLTKSFDADVARHNAEVKRLEDQLSHKQVASNPVPSATLDSGELSATGAHELSVGRANLPDTLVSVKKGEMLQLSILPKGNHGGDSTGIELEIVEQGGAKQVWNLTRDLLKEFDSDGSGAQFRDAYGHPSVWHAFDIVPTPTLFTQLVHDAEKTAGLQMWRGGGDTPSLFVNVNPQAIRFISISMPPRSVAMHPGPRGGVAVAWESPLNATVAVRARIFKIDHGGDGIAWKLEKLTGIGAQLSDGKSLTRELNDAQRKRDAFVAATPQMPLAYAVAEGKPTNAQIQLRGNPKELGDEVPRKFLDVLGGQIVPKDSPASGRLELGGWLTAPTNPLTARVIVNRIWQHHFGRGLVKTPNDFGTRGQPPTHPELLDHLATTLMQSGWKLKSLQRMIMLSATYQTSSGSDNQIGVPEVSTDHLELYARFALRRLSFEEIRDSMLAASGELDLSPGGMHPFPPEETWSFSQHAPFAADYDTMKRSVYLMTKRNRRQALLALFDGPDPNASTDVRQVTTVPTQALFFLNDPFVHARAARFAQRIVAGKPDDAQRLDLAYRILFGRVATATEQAEAAQFLQEYAAACTDKPLADRPLLAWTAYARVLLGSNETIHIE